MITALIRGMPPLSVMVIAELEALPRPGDTIIADEHAYTVTNVQFDLTRGTDNRDRQALYRGELRVYQESIVIHVA